MVGDADLRLRLGSGRGLPGARAAERADQDPGATALPDDASASNNVSSVIVTSGEESDVAPAGGNAAWTAAHGTDANTTSALLNVAGSSAQVGVLTTDTSGQIGLRALSGQNPNVYWVTRGFVDFRRS